MKVIIECPECKKKMKIEDKIAKYKCPHCGTIYDYTKGKQIYSKGNRIAKDAMSTFKEGKVNFKDKWEQAKATAKVMNEARKNQSQDKK